MNLKKMKYLQLFTFFVLSASTVGFAQVTESLGTIDVERQECLSAIEQLIYNSDRFQEVIGDMSFGMMLTSSPEPGTDGIESYSPLYEFTVTDNEEDHATSIAQFAFDTRMVKLFEYDPVEDQFNEIQFQRNDAEQVSLSCEK